MKFKNVKTGAILEPNSKFTEEQMKKSDMYIEIGKESKPKGKEPTVAEIKAKLDELGIEYDDSAVKADLLALLPQE